MGGIQSPPVHRRPGIAVVRYNLHSNTQENRDLFRRWTKLHMRDMLSLPHDEDLGGASRVLRYIRATANGGEEYLHTIVLDDVRLPSTEGFQNVPQRLDLENTRPLGKGEEPVLLDGDERDGMEPMVFSIVEPVADLFEEVVGADLERAESNCWKSYQDLPADIATLDDWLQCSLVTLTFSAPHSVHPPLRIVGKIHSSLVSFLTVATQTTVFASLYSHSLDSWPGGLPETAEDDHGCRDWLACVLVGGDADKLLLKDKLEGVEGQVNEWRKRMRLDGGMEGVNVSIEVWKGDAFMS